MPDLVVADSSPIVSFAKARKLHLIQKVCNEIIIPPAVYDEIVVRGKGKPGAEEIKKASWISVRKPKNQIEVEKLGRQFDWDESEAIILAEEIKAILLADERIIIKEARRKNLQIISHDLPKFGKPDPNHKVPRNPI